MREDWTDTPSQPEKGINLANTLTLDFWLPELWECILIISDIISVILCYGSHSKSIHTSYKNKCLNSLLLLKAFLIPWANHSLINNTIFEFLLTWIHLEFYLYSNTICYLNEKSVLDYFFSYKMEKSQILNYLCSGGKEPLWTFWTFFSEHLKVWF